MTGAHFTREADKSPRCMYCGVKKNDPKASKPCPTRMSGTKHLFSSGGESGGESGKPKCTKCGLDDGHVPGGIHCRSLDDLGGY